MFDQVKLEKENEKSYQSAVSDYETRKSRFETKKASYAEVFAELFRPLSLGSAKPFVERGAFRRTIYEMDRKYSSETSRSSRSGETCSNSALNFASVKELIWNILSRFVSQRGIQPSFSSRTYSFFSSTSTKIVLCIISAPESFLKVLLNYN